MRLLGSVWGTVAAARVRAYQRGWIPRRRLERPTLSVGAIEMGGTGKTPATAMLARLLRTHGKHPAILSRGYGRRSREPLCVSRGAGPLLPVQQGGDEPTWYAVTLPGVPVAVGRRREQAANLVADACDLFLLDDGFQHVRVRRDVDLLVVDADAPFWEQAPPPAGRLRESPGAARRADGFLLHGTRRNQAAAALQQRFPDRPIFQLRMCQDGFRELSVFWSAGPPSPAPPRPAFGLVAIARPDRVWHAVRAHGLELVGTHAFADHHWYRREEVRRIEQRARSLGAEILITTEKDAVKLAPLAPLGLPLYTLAHAFVPIDPERLGAWLLERLALTRDEPR